MFAFIKVAIQTILQCWRCRGRGGEPCRICQCLLYLLLFNRLARNTTIVTTTAAARKVVQFGITRPLPPHCDRITPGITILILSSTTHPREQRVTMVDCTRRRMICSTTWCAGTRTPYRRPAYPGSIPPSICPYRIAHIIGRSIRSAPARIRYRRVHTLCSASRHNRVGGILYKAAVWTRSKQRGEVRPFQWRRYLARPIRYGRAY